MEKGTIVRIHDSSYALELCGNELKECSRLCDEGNFIVITSGCVLPIGDRTSWSSCDKTNDTIVKSLSSGKIIFTSQRFLSSVHQCNICPKCGKTI